jgi:hypothetical protein
MEVCAWHRLRASALCVPVGILAGACSAAELKPFVFQPDPARPGQPRKHPRVCLSRRIGVAFRFCGFCRGRPFRTKVSFQIDQSGHEGTQTDVAANHPGKPVVRMLGACEPTAWNIGWSTKTKILAVFVSGDHRQAIAGLARNVSQLNSSYHDKG